MLLKRLEISGFKSFAKPITLEFPTKITAIVGPNGSGKSNIADAIRWVLGEQSMKHLRGKKGEDLIFGGTAQIARLAKASVSLVFNNKDKIFPVEFGELVVSRRVYRDGANDYVLNDSQARLKDIIELLSKVGLGASQHHIIAQGDSDRILYASPKEKKSMVEESLGLKIFELKKNEALRKLEAAENNIKQVESLKREIQPHLKYLESQAEKMKNAAQIRKDLSSLTEEYVGRELKTLFYESTEAKKEKNPLEARVKDLEKEIRESEEALGREGEAEKFFSEIKKLDEAQDAISKKRRGLEREAGRAEAASAQLSPAEGVPKDKIKSVLMDLASDLETASRFGIMEAVRNAIFAVTQKIYRFLESVNGEPRQKESLLPEGVKLKEEIANLEKEEKEISGRRRDLQKNYESRALKIQKEGALLRTKMEELAGAKDSLRAILGREERMSILKKEFELEFGQFLKTANPAGELLGDAQRADFRKKIERLRIRLEEAGGVDESALSEFEETKKRDEFLAKELEDLKTTAASLKNIFDELEERIAKDFDAGLFKINKLFGDFFREIFGGGKAEIRMERPEKKRKPSEENPEENWQEEIEEEPGLEITVDIPRKRIKSLAMLSGGERALTSIALLFAMSTANPPPFLVLDETDAALDEANSARYAAMLKDLGKKTQLVVVTHNRETMKVADVLYGVTMGADGISKLLSIKFEEAENVLAKKK
ncbi:MAG: AAA family ATPase [Candidatus Giovannonibacteria bacterium]|nr:MAG: AAA family ATPase [Candidatus Giovannonibacteria bacterium]